MKELLEEIVNQVRDPRDDKVWFKYVEQEGIDFYGRGLLRYMIVKQSPDSRLVYKQEFWYEPKLNNLDEMRLVLRKRIMKEVFTFGVFSALDSLEKYDKTGNS